MKIISVFLGYLKWHYGKALGSLTGIWKNFLYFISEFFSIRLLFRNFFDPWKRMSDGYPRSFDLKKYFYAFLANSITRLVGMIVRLLFIVISLACYVAGALLYPVAMIVWLLLPFITIILLGTGIVLIIN